MGSYRRGDPLWDIAHRGLQNTNGLRPLRSSPFVICYGYGHRSWHQDAIRLFGLLGGRCSILTRSEEHTSELQSLRHLVCRLLLEKKKSNTISSEQS